MRPEPSSPVPAALARAGLEVLAPVEDGAPQPRWLARGPGGERVLVVPFRGADDALLSRCRTLAQVRNPHLPVCAEPLELGDGWCGLPVEVVDGPDLATLVDAQGRLSPAQVVTVTVPIAAALGALHDAGVVHGDVAPANVVVRRDGRPVLVDLVHGASPREAGTPGFGAPERGAAATAAGDVHALARTALAVLTETGSAAHEALVGALRPALDQDPGRRPSAREVARAVYDAVPGAPLLLPADDVLAAWTLRRLADPAAARTVVPAARARGRHRRRRRPVGRHVAALGCTVVVAGLLVLATVHRTAGESGPGTEPLGTRAEASTVHGAPGPDEQPEAAAERLTRQRAAALADGDVARLADVSVPGSPAATADAAALQALEGATRTGGPEVEVLESRAVVDAGDGRTRVLVRSRAALQVAEDRPGPSVRERAVVLVLEDTGSEWRVHSVERP